MISEFSFPTAILFGPGAVEQLGERVREMKASRVQIVTDAGLVRAGLIDRIRRPLEEAGLDAAVFQGVRPEPVEANVLEGVAHYREARCDLIVAVGGGSSMDVAKAIRVKATHGLPLVEYTTAREGWTKIGPDLPPMIAIPTTSGTGSEVGRSALVIVEATGRKASIFSPHLIPNLALCDPELTLTLPPNLTAWTGADALTHNVESYLSNVYHPICEAIALQGVGLCFEHLATAVAQGDVSAARQGMMMAALMGGIAFQKDLGATHSLAHQLSVHCGFNHGLANAVMLPYVLRFNQAGSEAKLAELARAIGEETTGLDLDAAASRFVGRVEGLLGQIGIPPRLSALGVRPDQIDALASDAFADACHQYNPRACTAADLWGLYQQAL